MYVEIPLGSNCEGVLYRYVVSLYWVPLKLDVGAVTLYLLLSNVAVES